MRIGTLFSGIGAPEQGAKRVYDDLELVFACEFDKFARQSFEANYDIKHNHFHVDVNDMDGKQYKDKVDIIIGGSPCQDFSIAGLRAGIDGHRGQLIWQYYRIIMEAQPEIFIYENVKGMMSDKNGQTIKDFLQIFRESGYYCHHAVLNTKNYGVPQNRERVYIVGFKDHDLYHRFQFADKIKLEKRLKDVLESEVYEKYYLSDKMVKGFVSTGKDEGYVNQDTQASSVFSTEKESPSLCAGTHGYAQGYIKVEGMLNCKGTEQIRRVYGVDGVAATLTTMQGGNQEPKIKVKSATKSGYETATEGDSINLTHPDSKTRRGRVGVGVAQTLDCACNQAVVEAWYSEIKVCKKCNHEQLDYEVYGDNWACDKCKSYNPLKKEIKMGRIVGRNPDNPKSRERCSNTVQMVEENKDPISGCLTTVEKDNIVITDRIRKLTPRECLRLQDFPDTFKQVCSDSQQYKQAGNSMSVNILEMIFNQIEKAKQNEPTNTLMDFL